MTKAYPTTEIYPGFYEIDEFDCASVFVIVGDARALVVDTGIGIGDLRGKIAEITDLPYDVVITHGHGDHIGGAGAFDTVYMNEGDYDGYPFPPDMTMRERYPRMMAERSGKDYPYALPNDLCVWHEPPKRLPLNNGQVFDLGGRTVTAIACYGHTSGSVALVDSKTRALLAADCVNCNLLLGNADLNQAYDALKSLYARTDYDKQKVFNGHHDYRDFGAPLGTDVLPDAISALGGYLDGTIAAQEVPSPIPGWSPQTAAKCGRVFVTVKR